MNITTDKVFNNSTDFVKKAKESSITGDVGRVKMSKISEKLFKDFASVSSDDNYVKSKIHSNNQRLSIYEYNVSKSQFIDDKLTQITNFVDEGRLVEAWDVIKTSKFDKKTVLLNHFTEGSPIAEQLDYAKAVISAEKKVLDKEFAAIQVTSQNLSSITPDVKLLNNKVENNDSFINSDSINSTKLDTSRVMNLIG